MYLAKVTTGLTIAIDELWQGRRELEEEAFTDLCAAVERASVMLEVASDTVKSTISAEGWQLYYRLTDEKCKPIIEDLRKRGDENYGNQECNGQQGQQI
ncbi:MAG: hypothetical protein LBI54_01235 [Lachnospiraceae bacterium]|nr:hypothetical protein [Lachnospiraceae bacterium]